MYSFIRLNELMLTNSVVNISGQCSHIRLLRSHKHLLPATSPLGKIPRVDPLSLICRSGYTSDAHSVP